MTATAERDQAGEDTTMGALATRIARLEKRVRALAKAQAASRCPRCGELDLDTGAGPCSPKVMLPRDDEQYDWFCDACASWYRSALVEQPDGTQHATGAERIECPLGL